MRIFIRFRGDNDFINTIIPIMEIIRLKILDVNGAVPPTVIPDWIRDRDKLVQFVNQIIYGIYLGFQCDFDHRGRSNKIETYLAIDLDDILFDEEIDAFTNHNSDGAVYDTDLDYPGNNPISIM